MQSPADYYLASDAEPGSDTFMGVITGRAADSPIADAIAHAHAARAAIRDLDGQLPTQPLAITLRRRGDAGASVETSGLGAVAFAIGDHTWSCELRAAIDDERELAAELIAALDALEQQRPPPSGTARLRPLGQGATPFVTISIGDEPSALARHGHRRGWTTADAAGGERGPWFGLSRTGELAIVSTCHLAVDGYGHAALTALIGKHARGLAPRAAAIVPHHRAHAPPLARVDGGIALGVASRSIAMPSPRAIPLAYALGQLLHRAAGLPSARLSPAFQIPVARLPPAHRDAAIGRDPIVESARRRRRVVPAIATLRFAHGAPEPYDVFAQRVRTTLQREAEGRGMISRLLAAARAAPAPLAWKRLALSPVRPRWLDRFADKFGGRACLSRICVETPAPIACAVSAPGRIATRDDPFGGCVITIVDDGRQASITACGSGLAGTDSDAESVISELLERLSGAK